MKFFLMIIILVVNGCTAKPLPEECLKFDQLRAEERDSLGEILRLLEQGGAADYDGIEQHARRLRSTQQPMIERCSAAIITAGPSCSQFDDLQVSREINFAVANLVDVISSESTLPKRVLATQITSEAIKLANSDSQKLACRDIAGSPLD